MARRHRRVVVLSEVDRAALEAGRVPGPQAGPVASELPIKAAEDQDAGWGGPGQGGGQDSNDLRLLEDVPPHWGGLAGM